MTSVPITNAVEDTISVPKSQWALFQLVFANQSALMNGMAILLEQANYPKAAEILDARAKAMSALIKDVKL